MVAFRTRFIGGGGGRCWEGLGWGTTMEVGEGGEQKSHYQREEEGRGRWDN